MTAPLKVENIRRAYKNGKSTVGPWEVTYDGKKERLELYHYGHLLAWVTQPPHAGSSPELEAAPRPGYGFSKSDVEAIGLVARETGAQIRHPENIRHSNRSPYAEFGQSRPFPMRRERLSESAGRIIDREGLDASNYSDVQEARRMAREEREDGR
jgi:hypothetical protein